MQTILKRTITEEYECDRNKVLEFVNDNPDVIVIQEWMTLDDIIVELFERLDDSQLGDELFGQIDCDATTVMFTREDDE